MSCFDFALTIATGSIVAATVQNTVMSIGIGLASLAAIFAVQAVLSRFRFASDKYQAVTKNGPLLLVENREFLQENLAAANVTEREHLWQTARGECAKHETCAGGCP